MQKILFFLLLSVAFILFGINTSFGAVEIPGKDKITNVSIPGVDGTVNVDSAKTFGMKMLSFARLMIAGVALIYIVLIGVYMIIFSDSEEKIKRQKVQLGYVLLGFVFLNVPTLLYDIFVNYESGKTIGGGDWTDVTTQVGFWNIDQYSVFIDNTVKFLRVLIFGIAIIVFTWGALGMILSAGKEDAIKNAKNRMIYGLLGLLFMGFVEGWAYWVASPNGDLTLQITEKAGIFFGIAFFFVGPIILFFFMIAAYYYITSAGDETRAKKGKSIAINTAIATFILLASFSLIQEIIGFSVKK